MTVGIGERFIDSSHGGTMEPLKSRSIEEYLDLRFK